MRPRLVCGIEGVVFSVTEISSEGKGKEMRFLVKMHIPIEAGNKALRDPEFGSKMKELLSEMKAEAAYFTTVNGQRGGYIVVNLDDASKIPAIAEPLFFWFKADIEFIPVMLPEDLAKAGPAIETVVKKWG
jgi:hypothetical protein